MLVRIGGGFMKRIAPKAAKKPRAAQEIRGWGIEDVSRGIIEATQSPRHHQFLLPSVLLFVWAALGLLAVLEGNPNQSLSKKYMLPQSISCAPLQLLRRKCHAPAKSSRGFGEDRRRDHRQSRMVCPFIVISPAGWPGFGEGLQQFIIIKFAAKRGGSGSDC